MARSLLAACLAFAGIFVLAGAGWALVAGAFLVFALVPQGADSLLSATSRKAVAAGRRLGLRVKAGPRRAGAIGGMAAGIVLLPFGFSAAAGLGAALIALAVVLVGGSVLLGWNA